MSDEQFQKLHDTCEWFEQALQSHQPRSIEQCLATVASEIHDVLFAELLAIELERQGRGDRGAQIAAYRARFPERTADIARLVQDEAPHWLAETHDPQPRWCLTGPLSSGAISDQPADRIGTYKLLEHLGEGGMGIVYRAEQEWPVRRQVALKVVKQGRDALRIASRLESEGQMLARMNHVGIVKLLDVGTTMHGRLYLAMELVTGPRITEYCDQHHLSIQERLDLYIQICHAVQHAHQKRVAHCDLKPSNILIAEKDGLPIPKLIDFGLAKVVEQEFNRYSLFHDPQSLVGTPAYMSPEQADASNDAVGPLSDIYALGSLLYELLVGQPPFDGPSLLKSGLESMLRTIREVEPPPPSQTLSATTEAELANLAQKRGTQSTSLLNRVRGNLEGIVMKCLKKDPGQRYKTTGELAKAIRQYQLEMMPVASRQHGWSDHSNHSF